MSKFVMSKSSIIVYLESSPPFLLELIYACVLSIIIIVLIFTVRERTQFSCKTIQQKAYTAIHQKQSGDDVIVYSKLKKRTNSPAKYLNASDDSSQLSATTSETPTTRWSQDFKEAGEDFTFVCPSNQILRQGRTNKKRNTPLSRRGRSFSPLKTMNSPINKVTTQRIERQREIIDEMSPEEYESYVQSMTSIWNNLFNKPKTVNFSTMESMTIDEQGIVARDWKERLHSMLTYNEDILKTDSTLAVRGSDSEINFRVFTDSEVKMVDQPLKESTDSVYSSLQINLPGEYDNISEHEEPLDDSNTSLSTTEPNSSSVDEAKKKSQFDNIDEEK